MSDQPPLTTDRLILRLFELSDAPEVHHLASNRAIAATTLNIPYPYKPGMAESWIKSHQEKIKAPEQVNYAITLKAKGNLLGAIGLHLSQAHNRAELGYWIGQPYWGQGYCTEATRAVIAYGFEQLGLNRVFARHFANNPASGRVMQKAGMIHEGRLRQHILKWNEYLDMEEYGILSQDYGATW